VHENGFDFVELQQTDKQTNTHKHTHTQTATYGCFRALNCTETWNDVIPSYGVSELYSQEPNKPGYHLILSSRKLI
jgi:hypothetical protein